MEKSEFASLADLITQKDISYSSIVSEIHDRVLSEYRKLHPNEPKTVDVVVDAKSGEVRLMRDKEDVTPNSFSPIAEKIAREVLIEKLQNLPDKPKYSPPPNFPSKKSKIDYELLNTLKNTDKSTTQRWLPSEAGKFIVNLVFWGYNILFFFIILTFILNIDYSILFSGNFSETIQNIGLTRIAFLLIAGSIPLIASFIAVKYRKKISTEQLSKLFFLFEVPLVLISIVCANAFATSSPFLWFLLLMFVFTVPVFLAHLLKIKFRSKRQEIIALFLREALFLTSFYITLLFTFIVPLILGSLAKIVYEYISYEIVDSIVSTYRSVNPFEILLPTATGSFTVSIDLTISSALSII